jgi:hypothetical protein
MLQILYRPQGSRSSYFALPSQTLAAFDEIENGIEEKITPLLSELFR